MLKDGQKSFLKLREFRFTKPLTHIFGHLLIELVSSQRTIRMQRVRDLGGGVVFPGVGRTDPGLVARDVRHAANTFGNVVRFR